MNLQHIGETYQDLDITPKDGEEWLYCKFEKCTIRNPQIYTFGFADCDFVECRFVNFSYDQLSRAVKEKS